MKNLFIGVLAVLMVCAWWGDPCAGESKSGGELSLCLLDEEDFTPDGLPQKADDMESLFAYMNGGAEQYLAHGFRRAIFQTYRGKSGKQFSLEIFEMNNSDAAHAIYAARAGQGGKNISIGNEAVLEEYYLLFRKGRFYVSLTGFDSEKDTLDELIAAAGIVDKKIEKP